MEARTAFDEATKLKDTGHYPEALARAGHALALREAALGGAHPDVADCLHLMGDLYRRQGDLGRAEPLLQRALALREAALGKNHLSVASSLNNLAILYATQALHDRAEPLFQRALAINEAAPGDNRTRVAASLNNLANHYWELGLYSRAEPLVRRSLAIYEATPGTPPPLVSSSLSTLAAIFIKQGLHGQAEPLLERALAINETALGTQHPEVAAILNNLATLFMGQGLYGRAKPLVERALAIKEAAFGPHHLEIAYSLNNLASIYMNQGLPGRAEPLYQRALAIKEATLDPHHPEIALSLNSLAALYMEQGVYGRAEPLLQRSLAISDVAFDREAPLVLMNLAILRVAQHRLSDALPLFTRAFAMSEQRLRQEALDFSESRLVSFLQYLRTIEQVFYSLLREHPKDAQVQRLALSVVLLLKGRSIGETADIFRTLYRNLGEEERDTFERLRSLRTQLAALSRAGPGAHTPAGYQQRLETLAGQGDALEAELARRSAPLRALTALPPPFEIVDRVAASLPKDGALVELVAYQYSPLVPKPGTLRTKLPRQFRYLALVLFPDGSTRALDLGPAAPIDGAATRLRDALARRDARFQPLARALYRLVFEPLRPLLGNTRRLFLSPDGQLGLVPFAALHDGRGFLLDSFDFTYVTSGKDLLPRSQDIPLSASVFVLADPDFGASRRTELSASGHTTLADRPAALERFDSTLRVELTTTPWVPLPGTRREAESIQRLLPQAQLFLGPEATKERLFQLPTPGIVHLATHGFFLEDAPVPKGARAVGHFGSLGDNALAPRPPDPLLRSGLILAGARPPATDSSQPSTPPPDTALITALELAGLNLWGTQLVVLSACDTGRGDVKLGQGVYGLRRSLGVAGAETVVMSLWKVKDDSTHLLMDTYYRNLLAGQGRSSALSEAMRSLRVSRPHPHDWAPFIAVGSAAPLRALAPIPPSLPDGKPAQGQ